MIVVKGEKLLSPKEVSEQTSFSIQTLANWRSLKKGPRYKKIGRMVRYPLAEVLEWLQRFHTIETECVI